MRVFLLLAARQERSEIRNPGGRIQISTPDRVDGKMPISAIRREGSKVVVYLQNSTRSGETATLSRSGSSWKMESVVSWVA